MGFIRNLLLEALGYGTNSFPVLPPEMGFSLITVITDLIVIPTVSNLLNEYLGYGYKRKLLLEMPIPSSFKSGTGWVFTVTVISSRLDKDNFRNTYSCSNFHSFGNYRLNMVFQGYQGVT